MDKTVLVLSTSPRKGGNSDLLCDRFIQGAQEAGNTAEKVSLRNKRIGYCIACEHCTAAGICVIEDDMAEILEKMVAADVIVMATPVYFYTMDGQIKTLIDRTVARYTEISDKDFYFIATAAVESKTALDRTFDGFQGFLDCLSGSAEKGRIYGTGVWGRGEVVGTAAMDEAYAMGKGV